MKVYFPSNSEPAEGRWRDVGNSAAAKHTPDVLDFVETLNRAKPRTVTSALAVNVAMLASFVVDCAVEAALLNS